MSTAPPRLRVELPDSDDGFPRAGKIAIGVQEPTGGTDRFGNAITRPKAVDHFVVVEKQSTSADAAAAFASVYPGEPRELRCMLPGRAPEDVLEGAFKLYGTGKLKSRCDGSTCAERTATGGWETKGCVCAGLPKTVANRKGEQIPNPERCKLVWTFWVILPDVPIAGVWQIDTGSDISARAVARWLRMIHTLRGDLAMYEFTLGLRGVDVAPDGKAKTVHVLDPRATGATPRELITGAAKRAAIGAGSGLPQLPAPADDEPDGLVSGVDQETGEITQQETPAEPVGREDRAAWVAAGGSAKGDTPMDRLVGLFPALDDAARELLAGELRSRGIKSRGDLKAQAALAVSLAEGVAALATPPAEDDGEEVSGEVVPEAPTLPLPDGAA